MMWGARKVKTPNAKCRHFQGPLSKFRLDEKLSQKQSIKKIKVAKIHQKMLRNQSIFILGFRMVLMAWTNTTALCWFLFLLVISSSPSQPSTMSSPHQVAPERSIFGVDPLDDFVTIVGDWIYAKGRGKSNLEVRIAGHG